MESITCRKCGAVDQYTTRNNGPHIQAVCNQCDAHIKFLAQHALPVLHFGKYAGIAIVEINDKGYLQWLLKQGINLKEPVRQAILKQLAL